jgi:hypothetical protein
MVVFICMSLKLRTAAAPMIYFCPWHDIYLKSHARHTVLIANCTTLTWLQARRSPFFANCDFDTSIGVVDLSLKCDQLDHEEMPFLL